MLLHSEDVLRPNRSARLAAHLRAAKLDRELIAGADPAVSPQLAARAAQLTARPMRAAIADGLQRLMAGARGCAGRYQAPVAHRAINANAAELADLAETLRSDALLYAQGLAILHELVADGTGPAYGPGEGQALARRLTEARAAL
jgi:hypothetical protein